MSALRGDSWRNHVTTALAYTACRYNEVKNSSGRYRPAGDAEYFNDLVDKYRRSLKFVEQRKSLPPAKAFLGRNWREKSVAVARDIFLYEVLGTDIWVEDHCPHTKMGGYCVHGTILTNTEASGKNGRAEMARIVRDVRAPLIDPWFLIGPVDIDLDGEKESQKHDLQNRRREAMESYTAAKVLRDAARSALQAAIKHRDKNVAELNRIPDELAKKIEELKSTGKPDAASVSSGSDWKRIERSLDKHDRRLAQIGNAIDNLRENYPPNDSFATKRILALEIERAKIEELSSRLLDRQVNLLKPNMTGKQKVDLKRLTDRYDIERADADRRVAREDRRVDEAKRRANQAQDAFRAAETKWMALDAELKAWKDGAIKPVKRIRSDDAEIELVSSDLTKILDYLNDQIRKLEAQQRKLEKTKDRARQDMIDAARKVDDKADAALKAGIVSLGAQVGIEAAFAASDLRKAAAAGPFGVLIEATRQIAFNVAMPPSYVEADRGRLADYTGKTVPATGHQYLDVDRATWENRAVKQGIKQVASEPVKVLMKALEAHVAEGGLNDPKGKYRLIERVLRGGGASNAGELVATMAKERAAWDKAADDFAKMTLQKGASEVVKRAAKEFLKGVAKSAAKDEIKRHVAQLVEKPWFEDFMRAQAELALATGRFRQLSGQYWSNEDMLEALRAMRDPIRDGYSAADGMVVLRNEPFYADTAYQFEFEFGEEVDVAKVDANVSLGGIKLERIGLSSVWRLPENSESLYTHRMPERLVIRIEFR